MCSNVREVILFKIIQAVFFFFIYNDSHGLTLEKIKKKKQKHKTTTYTSTQLINHNPVVFVCILLRFFFYITEVTGNANANGASVKERNTNKCPLWYFRYAWKNLLITDRPTEIPLDRQIFEKNDFFFFFF